MKIEESEMLDVGELAESLNVTQAWVRSAVFQRKIPFVKVGKCVRFQRKEIERWIEERRIEEGSSK
jgi:excisionase family DNA binding protein